MEPFIGQIQLFGFNFAPRGWAKCEGQLLSISQNTALFSLLGTTYGGDGSTTFGLPDLRGRVPVGVGTGPGLQTWTWGEKQGTDTETLNASQIPPHSHTGSIKAANADGDDTDPTTALGLGVSNEDLFVTGSVPATSTGDVVNTTNTGGGQSHNNVQPSLGLHYCIALIGVYPSRN